MINSSFLYVMYIAVVLWVTYRLFIYIKNKQINLYREITLLLFLIYFLLLLNITIFKGYGIVFRNPLESYGYKEHGIIGIINFIPIVETIKTMTDGHTPIMNPLRNIFGNIIAFMPLGFFIPLLFSKYNSIKRIFLLGLTSSLAIELVQLFVGYNITDVDDLIYNTIGAMLGLLCFRLLKLWLKTISRDKKSNDESEDDLNSNNIIDKIDDNQTNNIFKKSLKVILAISVLVLSIYTYNVYEQTASDELSDVEIAQTVFKEDLGEILDIKNTNNEKLYLVKKEYGITIEKLQKYSKSRYIKSYEGFNYLEENDNGYKVEVLHKFNENMNEEKVSAIVFGKNTNATSIIINLNGIEYETKINPNEHFIAVYPEYVSINDENMNKLYNDEYEKVIKVKFLDENNNIVNDIKLIK